MKKEITGNTCNLLLYGGNYENLFLFTQQYNRQGGNLYKCQQRTGAVTCLGKVGLSFTGLGSRTILRGAIGCFQYQLIQCRSQVSLGVLQILCIRLLATSFVKGFVGNGREIHSLEKTPSFLSSPLVSYLYALPFLLINTLIDKLDIISSGFPGFYPFRIDN